MPWLTACVIAVCSLLHWVPSAPSLFEYHSQTGDLAATWSEPWRLWTGHWVHWSDDHLLWNLLAIGWLGAIYESRGGRRRLGWCLGLAPVGLSLGFALALPEMTSYRGLSGVACTVMAALIIELVLENTRNQRSLVLPIMASAALIAKLGYEALTHDGIFVDQAAAGFLTVPMAHWLGALVGTAVVVACELRANLGGVTRRRLEA